MKITLATLLEGVEYTPVPGNEYEIAEGIFGTLRAPTQELVDEISAASSEPDVTDLALAKKVLRGLKPFDDKKAIMGAATAAVQDFFTCLERTVAVLNARSKRADPSAATA